MAPLKRVMSRAVVALDAVTPWPSEHTVEDLRWAPSPGRVGILLRSNEPESTPTRLGWIGNKARAWAWTGVLGADLLPLLRGNNHTVPAVADALDDGIGSFAMVGATPDSLRVFTNVHRSEAMYYAEVADVVLFSNSAAVLNLVRHGSAKPVYSPLGVAAAIVHGLPVTDSTPFADVRIAPPGSRLVSDPSHDLRIEDRYVWSADAEASLDEVARLVADSLVTYAETLAGRRGEGNRSHHRRQGQPTSRLYGVTAAGVPFTTYTNGLDESGEVHIGQAGGSPARGGAPHQSAHPDDDPSGKSFVAAQPELQAWTTLLIHRWSRQALHHDADPARTTCSSPIRQPRRSRRRDRPWRLGPFAGRHRPQPRHRTPAAPPALVQQRRPPLARWRVRRCDRDLARNFERIGDVPVRGMLDAYVRNRTGRWLATMRLASPSSPRTRRCSSTTAWCGGPSRPRRHPRRGATGPPGDEHHHPPGVADVPLFRDRWAFEAKAPNAFHDPEDWADRDPYTATTCRGQTSTGESLTPLSLARYFTAYVLDHPSSLLFDVMDRRRVEQHARRDPLPCPGRLGLFSTQYTLNNGWLGERPSHPTPSRSRCRKHDASTRAQRHHRTRALHLRKLRCTRHLRVPSETPTGCSPTSPGSPRSAPALP